jgi:hypothetical protein
MNVQIISQSLRSSPQLYDAKQLIVWRVQFLIEGLLIGNPAKAPLLDTIEDVKAGFLRPLWSAEAEEGYSVAHSARANHPKRQRIGFHPPGQFNLLPLKSWITPHEANLVIEPS